MYCEFGFVGVIYLDLCEFFEAAMFLVDGGYVKGWELVLDEELDVVYRNYSYYVVLFVVMCKVRIMYWIEELE